MNDFLIHLIPSLEHLNNIGYLIVFFAAFLESIIITGYFIPGSTIVLIFGILAGGLYYDLGDVLFFAILGNILGNNVSYYIGKKIGNNVFKDGFYFIKAEHFIKAEKFFKKHGGKSVLFGKLIPGVKETIPIMAGILEMKIYKFLFYNIIGAIIWGIIFVGIGYIFSSSLLLAEIWATRFGYIIIILSFIFLVIFVVKYLFTKYGNTLLSLIIDGFLFLKQKFISNKKVKIFVKKYPKIIFFLKNRIKKDDFFGLPFTILLFLILYLITEYIGFTDAVLDGELITKIDIRLSDFFYYFKDSRLVDFFLFISYFGNTLIVLLISIITTIILFIKGKRYEIIGLITSVGISSLIAILSKVMMHRTRPEFAVYIEKGYSLPSFHANISVALYGFIIWLFLVSVKKWKTKINLIFIGIIIAFTIGFSRLYLNVHYLSDVILGWFLGFLGLTLGITIIGYLKNKYKIKSKLYLNEYNKIFIYLLIISFIIFSIFYYKIYYNKIVFTNFLNKNYIQITNIKDFLDKNPHLKYTETITGRETEPINFIFIVKNESDLLSVFEKSGWYEADNIGRTSFKKIGSAIIGKVQYDTAPITPLYYNKEIQTFGLQKLTVEENIKYRHHIRVWKTDYKIGDNFIYIACGIYDDGFKWGITHKIDPDLNKEREYIFNDLNTTGEINKYNLIQLDKPSNGTNFSGDKFYADGYVYLIEL